MAGLSRRDLLKIGGATALGSALVGCGPGDSGGGGVKEVRVAWSSGAERSAAIVKALDWVQSQGTGWKVTGEYGATNALDTRVKAQLAAGAGPDIYQTHNLDIGSLVHGNAALDLTSYIPGTIQMSKWDEQAITGGRVQGKQYSISTGSNTVMAMYDPNLTKPAGLEVLRPDWHWADLPGAAEEIHKASGRAIAGIGDSSMELLTFQVYLRSQGGELFDANGTFLPTATEIGEYWNYWQGMRKSGACTSADIAAKFNDSRDISQNALALKKAAIIFDFSNRLPSVEEVTNTKLSSTTYPMGQRPGMYIRPSLLWMVSSHSKNPELACRVVNGLVNGEGAADALTGQLGVPDNPALFARVRAGATDKRQYDYIDLVRTKKYVTELKDVNLPPGGGDMFTAFGTTAEKVAFGQLSVADGASNFMKLADKALHQQR